MRFFVAFFISLFIYVLLIWLFLTKFPQIKTPKKSMDEKIVKIDIINMPLPKPPPPSTVEVKREPKKEKHLIKKKLVKKSVVKKKIVKKKKVIKKRKIIKKKIVKKKIIKKKVIQEPKAKVFEEEMVYIEEPFITQPKEVKAKNDDLASFLSTPSPSIPSSPRSSYPNKKIQKLYGSTFFTFSLTQQKFIEDKLNEIQRITQNLLTRRDYPEGAGRTGQEGTNVVTFNLHPNGDISDLRLKRRTGSRPLDENTLSLIRSAYKDYPYPSTTTRIVFYVTYTIYGY